MSREDRLDPIAAGQVWQALRPIQKQCKSTGAAPPDLDAIMAWLAERAIGSAEVNGSQRRSISAGRPATPQAHGVDGCLLPPAAAAEYAGISLSTLQRRARAGAITPRRHGSVVRYHRDDLDKLGKDQD